jgi:hypothetical protein
MPTYSIDGPDGKNYSIDGPEGATRDQVIAQIKKQSEVHEGTVPVAKPYQTWPQRIIGGIADSLVTGARLTKEAVEGDPNFERDINDPAKYLSAASLGVTGAPEVGEVASGLVNLTQKAGQLRKELPATQEIKDSAQAAYKAVEDARLIASEGSLNSLVSATRAGLDQSLMDSTVAPRSFKALEQLQKSGGDIAGILSVRQRLGQITPDMGTDFAAAQHIRDSIDHYVANLPATEVVSGDPQFTQAMLEHARSSWKAYAQLDQLESAMRIGQHKADVSGTGANTQNAMRQRIRDILDSDKKSRGYSKEAKKQMEDIVSGTWLTNAARKLGKFAPTGPVSAITTGMAALGGDIAGGRGMATAMALGVAIPATIAKYLGTYLTKNQILKLENLIRSESPLGKAAVSRVKGQPQSGAADLGGAAATIAPPVLAPDAVQSVVQ